MTGPGCGRTVMVVEDDVDIRDSIHEVLADLQYRPVSASDGAAALDQLKLMDPKPCVILLDMMMPILDGPGFRQRQQQDPELSGIPVVILSAHAEARATASEMQVAAFLKKPVKLQELLDTIEQFCVRD
jgi:two-component system, OmpR family, response regulator CpxR